MVDGTAAACRKIATLMDLSSRKRFELCMKVKNLMIRKIASENKCQRCNIILNLIKTLVMLLMLIAIF